MKALLKSLVVTAAVLTATASSAQVDNTLRVRGTITALEGQDVTVQTTAGQSVKVKLSPNYTALLYTPIKIEDVKPNAYVAAASAPQPDGSLRALALVVFPEGMRGLNEGSKGWDLTPGSRMTNATIAQLVGQDGGREITVRYETDKTQKIAVPERTPVASFVPTDKAAVAIGAKTVIFATRNADGTISGGLIGVGKDGFMPPV